MNYSVNYESPGLVSHPTLGIGRVVSAEAEFEDMEEEIIGADERVLVPDTKLVPYRWVCSLEMYFEDPDNPEQILRYPGIGTLISDKHVLTCGHVIVEDIKGTKGTVKRLKAKRITVIPGRNGLRETEKERMPFRSSGAESYDAADGWKTRRDYSYDFGVIKLKKPPGKAGYWGSDPRVSRLEVVPPAQIRGQIVHTSGYPFDKCRHLPQFRSAPPPEENDCADRGSTQWRTSGPVTGMSFTNQINYTLDSKEGQSGSPVWLRDAATGVLRLIAVHSGPNDAKSNQGLLMTDEVLRQVREWMVLPVKKGGL